MEIAEVVMNPVRQRIFQYFLLHEAGTVKELKRALPDVPNASLYRHIKVLAEHSILTVVGENRIRGTVESVYQLNKEGLATEDEGGNAVQMSLLSICASFARYFAGDDVDPKRDMLLLTECHQTCCRLLFQMENIQCRIHTVRNTTSSSCLWIFLSFF